MLTIQQFDDYVKALSFHDWTYDYSDDGNVWRAGRAAATRLLEQAKDEPKLKAAYAAWSTYIWGERTPEAKKVRQDLIDALRASIEQPALKAA